MNRILIVAFLFSYLIYHLITLLVSPLPWFDEIIFNSISHSFATNLSFHLPVAPLVLDGQEVIVYGPVYFVAAGLLEKMFGFGMFQYRILSLLSGLLYIFMILVFIRKYIPGSQKKLLLLLLIICFDPVLNSSMHGGRMDLLASSLVLLSILFFFKTNEKGNDSGSLIYMALSGLLAALAVLTTPRVGIMLISITLVFLYRFFSAFSFRRFSEMTVWALVFLLPVLAWLNYIYMLSPKLLDTFAQVYVFGGNFFYPKERHQYALTQYPLIFLSFLVVSIGIWSLRKKYFSEFTIISILNIFAFYLLIFEVGGYYVIIVPFFYFLIFNASFQSNRFVNKYLIPSTVVILLVFNFAVFSIKTFNIIFTLNERLSDECDYYVRKLIPAGSKVIGDEPYYYSVIGMGSEFQLINKFSKTEEREKFQRENFDYDYLVISELLEKTAPALLPCYLNNSQLQKIASISYPERVYPFKIPCMPEIFNSYKGTIYKRIKSPS